MAQHGQLPLEPTYPHIRLGDEFWASYTSHPTIIYAEILFISLSLLCLLHALSTSRYHTVAWVAAITSGTANDVFFMYLPFADNFWHAQCTIMLSSRLPLYIPAAYSVFQYVGIATSLVLPPSHPIGRCAYSALVSCFFYALYDLVGARYLWWTWHSTDAAVFNRWMGVPIGSTMWTLVHVAVFSGVLHWQVIGRKGGFLNLLARGVVATGLLCTPLMMIAMGPFQLHQLSFTLSPLEITSFPGKPDSVSISLVISVLAYLSGPSLSLPRPPPTIITKTLYVSSVIFHLLLLSIPLLNSPSDIISTGIHQPLGPCKSTDYDLSGYERLKYYCADEKNPGYDTRYFTLCMNGRKKMKTEGVEWYTVCGNDWGGEGTGKIGLVVTGALLVAINAYLMLPMVWEGGGGKWKRE